MLSLAFGVTLRGNGLLRCVFNPQFKEAGDTVKSNISHLVLIANTLAVSYYESNVKHVGKTRQLC